MEITVKAFYANNLYEGRTEKGRHLKSSLFLMVFLGKKNKKLQHVSSLILKGGGGVHEGGDGGGKKKRPQEKGDLSFNGQLMMSYHYTQILWSPSKPAPLCADWLTSCERGRVCVFFFPSLPLVSGLIPVPQWAHLSFASLSLSLSPVNSVKTTIILHVVMSDSLT